MQCELCGKDTELFTAVVEGIQLRVCAGCGRFGKVLRRAPPPASLAKPAPVRTEPAKIERIMDDYGQRIRAAREKQGLTQEDFAKRVMVKESLVHKMETGTFEPDIELARKLERLLHIRLVEVREESETGTARKEDRPAGLTIGDILKLKS